jgi:hypothetical protein
MLRYKLRTLLIVLAIGQVVLVAVYYVWIPFFQRLIELSGP